MDASQIRAQIRNTLNETWLDFYRRIPHQPRSVRYPEYVEISSREGFRAQSNERYRGIAERRKCIQEHRAKKAREAKEKERRDADARAREDEQDEDVTMDEDQEDVEMQDVRTTTTIKPVLTHDGSCPFWIDPEVPPSDLITGGTVSNPPSSGPTTAGSTQVPIDSKPFAPSFMNKSVFLVDRKNASRFLGSRRQVKTFHRPGFMEPISHGKYLPRTAFSPSPNTGSRITRADSRMNPTSTKLTARRLPVDLDLYGPPCHPARPYKFCNPISSTMWVSEQVVLPFLPTFEDGTVWNIEGLQQLYDRRYAWNEEDRDPDIDIILIEVLARLKSWRDQNPRLAEFVSLPQIQATGILPQTVDQIEEWRAFRDLFPFPLAIEESGSVENGMSPRLQEQQQQIQQQGQQEQHQAGMGGGITPATTASDPEVREVDNMVARSATPMTPTTAATPGPGMPGLATLMVSSTSKRIEAGPSRLSAEPSRFNLSLRTSTSATGLPGSLSRRQDSAAPSSHTTKRAKATTGGYSTRRDRRRPRPTWTDVQVRELKTTFIEPRRCPEVTDRTLAEERDKEEEMFSTMRNQQELICPNGSCRMYACPFHLGDAAIEVIPYLDVSTVPPHAKALLHSEDLERKCSDECYFALRGADDNVCTEMREADKHLLRTFLSGLPGDGGDEGLYVCDLVDLFAMSQGPKGSGWSCLQLGLHVKRLFDAFNSTAVISASNVIEPVIVPAANIKAKDTLPDKMLSKRASQIQKQIRQLTGGASGRSSSDPPVSANEPIPVFEQDNYNMVPNDLALCSHEGPCTTENCECFRKHNYCTRECRCPPTCRRRHPGCRCTPYHLAPGLPEKRATCGTDKCPCFKAGRECDPESCGDCGAREEVELAIRPADNRVVQQMGGQRWLPGRCRNVGLRSGEFQPVRVDYSNIHGYGLFAKVDMPNNTLIIEYVGEMVNNMESSKRENLSSPLGVNYLFGINNIMDVDSFRRGNASRFINEPNDLKMANCGPRIKIVQGNHRVEIRAIRAIRQGEELLMDYGKKFHNKEQQVHASTSAPALKDPAQSKRAGKQKEVSTRPPVKKQVEASSSKRKSQRSNSGRSAPSGVVPLGQGEPGPSSTAVMNATAAAAASSSREKPTSAVPGPSRAAMQGISTVLTSSQPPTREDPVLLDDPTIFGEVDQDSSDDPDYEADSAESDHSMYTGETTRSRKKRRIFQLASRR